MSKTKIDNTSKNNNRIQELRLEKKLTQKELIDLLKEANIVISQSSLSEYEKNKVQPKNNTYIALSKIFDTSVTYVMGLDKTKQSFGDWNKEVDNAVTNKRLTEFSDRLKNSSKIIAEQYPGQSIRELNEEYQLRKEAIKNKIAEISDYLSKYNDYDFEGYFVNSEDIETLHSVMFSLKSKSIEILEAYQNFMDLERKYEELKIINDKLQNNENNK